MSEASIALTRRLIEYGKRKGVPQFVSQAAELLAVCDTGCDRLSAEIERLRKCQTCGTPLSRDCPSCQKAWES